MVELGLIYFVVHTPVKHVEGVDADASRVEAGELIPRVKRQVCLELFLKNREQTIKLILVKHIDCIHKL